MTLQGIDVSNWQGSAFPWEQFRGKIQFAFAKATEGTQFVDPDFVHNIAMMREIGIIAGAYHFFRPVQNPVKQMGLFEKVCSDAGIRSGDLISLDHEESDGITPSTVAERAVNVAGYMSVRWRCSPFIYTYQTFATSGYCAGLGGFPLWRADPDNIDAPAPDPWTIVSIDQYSTSPEDQDRAYFATKAQLETLAVGSMPAGHPGASQPVAPAEWDEHKLWHIWHLVDTGQADVHIQHVHALWVRYFAEVAAYSFRDQHLDHVLVYARDVLHVRV